MKRKTMALTLTLALGTLFAEGGLTSPVLAAEAVPGVRGIPETVAWGGAAAASNLEVCLGPAVTMRCGYELSWLAFEAGMCALGALGFVKGAKVIKAIAKAIKAKAGIVRAIVGGLGAFFCIEMYESLQEYSDCMLGMQDVHYDGAVLRQEEEEDHEELLADYLYAVAAQLEAGWVPMVPF